MPEIQNKYLDDQINVYDGKYVDGYAPWSTESLPYLTQQFLDQVRDGNGKVVVDLCGGKPANVINMAKKAPELEFVSVDSSETAYSVGLDMIASEGLAGRVRLVKGDVLSALKLPELQDLLTEADVFEKFGLTTHALPEDREAYYGQVRGLLRTDGLHLVSAFGPDKYFYEYKVPDNRDLLLPMDDSRYPGVFQHFYTLEELETQLKREGFDVINSLKAVHYRAQKDPNAADRFVVEALARYA